MLQLYITVAQLMAYLGSADMTTIVLEGFMCWLQKEKIEILPLDLKRSLGLLLVYAFSLTPFPALFRVLYRVSYFAV
jgi:hypothetical protein